MSEENNQLKNIYKLNFNTSLAHIIGNITMLSVENYKEQFPKKFFKSYYINTTLSARTFVQKKNNIVNLKQRKPILSANPNVSTDLPEFATTSYFNNVYGKDVYSARGGNPMTSTLFYNKDTATILEFSINRLKMSIEMTHTYETLIQQLNAFGIMKSAMRIDHPYRFTALVEVPIPNAIISDIMDKLNMPDATPQAIKDYLNKFSAYPVTYKLETSTGNFRFFFALNTNIQILLETPSINDGEQKGQIYDNFELTQNVNIEFNYVDTFYYISNKVIPDSLLDQNSEENMGYVTIVPVLTTNTGLIIPEVNKNGRVFYIASEIIMDGENQQSNEDVTDITGLLTVYDFQVLDEIAKHRGVTRQEIFDKYYEVEFYRTEFQQDIDKDYKFNSKTMELTIIDPDIFTQYSVLIYRDNTGINTELLELDTYLNK